MFGAIRQRAVRGDAMHEDNAARRCLQRHDFAEPATVEVVGDHAGELAVVCLVAEKMSVMSGKHAQAAVCLRGIVEVHEYGDDIVVGAWIVSHVLMPLDDRTNAWRLHVQLRILQQDIGADQLLDAVQQAVVLEQRAKCRVQGIRVVDPAG